MRRYRAVVIVTLLLLPGLAPAQVYKCTGKDGRVTYSQTRPRDADCKESRITPTESTGANVDDLKKYSEKLDQSRQADTKDRQKAEREQAQQAQRQARCSAARSRVAFLDQASRLVTIDEKGERHYQDDAQKQQLKNEAQQAVAQNCG